VLLQMRGHLDYYGVACTQRSRNLCGALRDDAVHHVHGTCMHVRRKLVDGGVGRGFGTYQRSEAAGRGRGGAALVCRGVFAIVSLLGVARSYPASLVTRARARGAARARPPACRGEGEKADLLL
jgi:hypothetical protein